MSDDDAACLLGLWAVLMMYLCFVWAMYPW